MANLLPGRIGHLRRCLGALTTAAAWPPRGDRRCVLLEGLPGPEQAQFLGPAAQHLIDIWDDPRQGSAKARAAYPDLYKGLAQVLPAGMLQSIPAQLPADDKQARQMLWLDAHMGERSADIIAHREAMQHQRKQEQMEEERM